MDLLKGFTWLLVCQSAGEVMSRLWGLPLPGPVLGLLLLLALLQWPPVQAPVEAAATPLLQHLSLLFVPVGVGVVVHLSVIAQYGLRMAVALVLSTWIGLAVTALVLKAVWPRAGADDATGGAASDATAGPAGDATGDPTPAALNVAPGGDSDADSNSTAELKGQWR